ncbi:MAG: MBL fold metallo-hydrolase [Bacteroidales bacterium]|nr:MBL fold metallo-hydrolase [Bacteroidales bacterium]MBK8882911.1 MBL fold metallo-hydrolase [Bacteroidales bacterium]
MEIFRLVFSPIEVNTYILADQSGDCAIIDCGCYDSSEFDVFVRFIESKKLNPVLLLNTHCHLDHIFGNSFILEKYNLKALSALDDEYNRKKSVQHAALFGLTMNEPPEPEGFITDGQVIKFGNVELKALHVPGHSSGSMAFYSEKSGVVFTGDALFAGSIGRTDLEGGNHATLIRSIQNRLFVLPPSTVVYPGHGSQTTIEKERMTNPHFS